MIDLEWPYTGGELWPFKVFKKLGEIDRLCMIALPDAYGYPSLVPSPLSHTRERGLGTRLMATLQTQENKLYLSIKQYLCYDIN